MALDQKVIRGNDTVRGTDVEFTITLPDPDSDSGELVDLPFIHAKNWETTAEINKEDVPRIGTRIVGKKNGTITYSGSCTVYFMDSTLRKTYMNYISKGIWPEITATVINYDKDSAVGKQIAVHKGIKFDSIILSKFDAESVSLEEDLDFTFEGIQFEESFKRIDDESIGEKLDI